jgi:dTDP-4-amino-4,6-dideoxygalactose transaminase
VADQKIPFNRASLTGAELANIGRAVEGGHISGDGYFTEKCRRLLEQVVGSHAALLTTSCTHALEMCGLLLDIKPGDEVIVPSFTFVSTVNAFVLRGARPVFVDIRPDTLNLDESLLESKITERTRAIVVVHYAGVACEMAAILRVAGQHGIPVIEDNAHGLFGRYRHPDSGDRALGSMGALATLSFHETKNISCGEGGALLINQDRFATRAEILREKGTNRAQFFRGEIDKYSWVDVGSSYLPSDMLAAFLYAQLSAYQSVQSSRERIWNHYYEELQEWSQENGFRLPIVPAHCDQPYHMFYLLAPSLAARTSFIGHLKDRGIMAVFHYLPLHLSRMGQSLGGKRGDCVVTEDVSDRLVRLPLYPSLSAADLSRIVDSIKRFQSTASRSSLPRREAPAGKRL